MHTINEIEREIPGVSPAAAAPEDSGKLAPGEFDILELLLILAARKRFIFLSTAICLATAMAIAFLIRPTFTAEAVIMPPQAAQSSASALLGQFGALASMSGAGSALGGASSALGLKNPSDLYIGLLKSESVADDLIKQFGLQHLYRDKRMSQTRKTLAKKSDFLSGKDSLIDISVKDHDPHRAAAMANAYVSELFSLNNRLAITEASQKRLFFEQQLNQEKNSLADAEVALKKTEESTGVILPTGQTENIIRQVAQLQAQITSGEVQLEALKMSSTDQNPDVVRLNTELDGMRAQLRDLESGQGKHLPGDISVTTANVPTVGLEYVRKERDVKYHQLLYDLLARQYEAARMDEAKAAPVIQVVDPALTPDWKSSPSRALWTIVGAALGFLFSCFWVLGTHVLHRLEADPEQAQRIASLKRELKLRG